LNGFKLSKDKTPSLSGPVRVRKEIIFVPILERKVME